mmetsp:Transcript_66402/g.149155  ORF Transcript_66402/g.149155 Transcript_66402/m.149155 type:complete len:273 (+) Transcript_66402:607-1425(+)
MILPLLSHRLLLLHEIPQLLYIGEAGVGWHEEVALFAAIREMGVEDGLQQADVLLVLGVSRLAFIETRPEDLAQDHRSCIRGEASVPRPLLWSGEIELASVEIHAPGPSPLNGSRDEVGSGAAGIASEASQAEVYATVQTPHVSTHSLISVQDKTIAHMNLGIATLVPQLRDLCVARRHLLVCEHEPRLLQINAGVDDELCQNGGFCRLSQVIDGALPLCDEVEPMGEGRGVLDKGVIHPGCCLIHQTVGARDLLPCLHTHLHVGDQHIVGG